MFNKFTLIISTICILFIGLFFWEHDNRVKTELKLQQVTSQLNKHLNYIKDIEKEKQSIDSKYREALNKVSKVQNACGKEEVPSYLLELSKEILGE